VGVRRLWGRGGPTPALHMNSEDCPFLSCCGSRGGAPAPEGDVPWLWVHSQDNALPKDHLATLEPLVAKEAIAQASCSTMSESPAHLSGQWSELETLSYDNWVERQCGRRTRPRPPEQREPWAPEPSHSSSPSTVAPSPATSTCLRTPVVCALMTPVSMETVASPRAVSDKSTMVCTDPAGVTLLTPMSMETVLTTQRRKASARSAVDLLTPLSLATLVPSNDVVPSREDSGQKQSGARLEVQTPASVATDVYPGLSGDRDQVGSPRDSAEGAMRWPVTRLFL